VNVAEAGSQDLAFFIVKLNRLKRAMFATGGITGAGVARSKGRYSDYLLAVRPAILHEAKIADGLLVLGDPSLRFISSLPFLTFG
jgi:hypothetical protein